MFGIEGIGAFSYRAKPLPVRGKPSSIKTNYSTEGGEEMIESGIRAW
jgi:hypothetical protein